MFIAVTNEVPELFNDPNNKWTKIGEGYFQSDNKKGITLEIFHTNNIFRWSLYDDNSPDPETPVTQEEKPTMAEALADVYDYLKGNEEYWED